MHCISVRLRMSLSWTSISNLITMTLIIMIFIGVNARYSIEFVESVLLRESEKKFWFFFHEKVLLIEWRVQVILLPTFYYVECKRFGCLTGIFVVRACTHHFFYSKNTFMVHFSPFLFIISLSISLDEKTWIFLRN